MKVAVFSAKKYDKVFLEEANQTYKNELVFLETHLTQKTADLCRGFGAVCVFVNDTLDRPTLKSLGQHGVKLAALRCAGFNNVDLSTAKELGITVVRVSAYSPYAVAEHTIALLLSVNRKVHRAYNRVREGNFALDGLLGFDINGLTVGIVGTGKIGEVVAKILGGFGCNIIGYDVAPNPKYQELGGKYVGLAELFAESDIVTLHCPLTPETHHIINDEALARMKNGVVLINTSRGALIYTKSVIRGLKSGKIGYLALDVYEEEGDLFFEDLSSEVIQDDVFARLLTFPNVFITGHQAFFTRNALKNIAETTLANISEFEKTNTCKNEVTIKSFKK